MEERRGKEGEMCQTESKKKGRLWGAISTPEVCRVLPCGLWEALEEFEQESDLI